MGRIEAIKTRQKSSDSPAEISVGFFRFCRESICFFQSLMQNILYLPIHTAKFIRSPSLQRIGNFGIDSQYK